MEQNKILEALENKLTGEIEKDYHFLLQEATHFVKIGLPDLVTPILNLLEKKYGNEGKKFIISQAKATQDKRRNMYKEVVLLEQKKEYAKAQELIVKLIDTFPTKRNLSEEHKLVSFHNLFENAYYEIAINKGKQKLYKLEEPLTTYYFHLGYILFQMEDYEETIKMLDIGLQYNETSVDSIILKGEAFYHLGRIDSFLDNITLALSHAYNRFHMANCYYQLARYYLGIGDKLVASACYYLSKNYIRSEQVDNLYNDIQLMAGESIDPRNLKQIKETLDSRKIQFGPHPRVLSTLKRLTDDEKTKANPRLMKYFLSIVFDLTKDPKVKEELDKYLDFKPEEKNE